MSEWIKLEDKEPEQLEVRIKLTDGSELNCWTQSDGDFYCKKLGVFISCDIVVSWKPAAPVTE